MTSSSPLPTMGAPHSETVVSTRVSEPSCATTALSAVYLDGVGKSYGALEALRSVSLSISRGEFVCIVGASGCGKSTLLRMIAGFEEPTTGTLMVDGQVVSGPGPDRGVVFQDYGLFPWLTVAGNIAYGPRRRGIGRAEVKAVVERFCGVVGLAAFADKYPHELSGGMQQRVAIARVLANGSGVLLMDEPFGALDALTRSSMQAELHQLWGELNSTILFVTHSVEEAVYLADRVVVMTGGPRHDTPGHIGATVAIDLKHPRDPTSAAFNARKRELLAAIEAEPTVASTPG